MSVDRHRDGRLEVLTETPGSRIPSRGPERGRPPKVIRTIPRWLRRTVPAITIGCFAAAAVLLITARPWVPPPRADIVAVPAPAPRQQEAFDLLARWYAARNNADPALMRSLTCAKPSGSVLRDIDAIEQQGAYDKIVFPEAIVSFEERKTKFLATMAFQAQPVNEQWKTKTAEQHNFGGFFRHDWTLTDEHGLKVCDLREAYS